MDYQEYDKIVMRKLEAVEHSERMIKEYSEYIQRGLPTFLDFVPSSRPMFETLCSNGKPYDYKYLVAIEKEERLRSKISKIDNVLKKLPVEERNFIVDKYIRKKNIGRYFNSKKTEKINLSALEHFALLHPDINYSLEDIQNLFEYHFELEQDSTNKDTQAIYKIKSIVISMFNYAYETQKDWQVWQECLNHIPRKERELFVIYCESIRNSSGISPIKNSTSYKSLKRAILALAYIHPQLNLDHELIRYLILNRTGSGAQKLMDSLEEVSL